MVEMGLQCLLEGGRYVASYYYLFICTVQYTYRSTVIQLPSLISPLTLRYTTSIHFIPAKFTIGIKCMEMVNLIGDEIRLHNSALLHTGYNKNLLFGINFELNIFSSQA